MVKLITWNCQGAFRKKFPLIAEIKPDLAVIQECEHPERIPWKKGQPPTTALWFGEKPSKGLGIFSWTGLTIEAVEDYDHTIRYCIPLRITAPYQFNLIAVWAMDHKMSSHSYSGQVYQAIGAYRDFILAADTVFMGDYNSSAATTPKSRLGNHPTLAMNLHDLWLVSAYHQFYFERQGQEKRWTYFQGRKINRRSHIDYAYIPSRWTRRLSNVQVGEPGQWLEHSDHCPVIVEIQEKAPGIIV
jgi:exodeoxyribonuclease III